MALFEKNWYTVPWKLVQNKIVRYPGGREIDRFRGIFPGRFRRARDGMLIL